MFGIRKKRTKRVAGYRRVNGQWTIAQRKKRALGLIWVEDIILFDKNGEPNKSFNPKMSFYVMK